jgi:hypothetical protein
VALLASTGGIVSVTRDGVVTGGTDGIVALAGGASSVGGTGDVTGTTDTGIRALGDTADVTRDGAVSGGTDGIVAVAAAGASVGGTGDVTGTTDTGITAVGDTVDVTRDGGVTGGVDGIVALAVNGATVGGTGDVTGTTDFGILAAGSTVDVTRDGVISGGIDGIAALAGDTASVTGAGDVTGATGAGIVASGVNDVTVARDGAVDGGVAGIVADTSGAGTLAVTVSGTNTVDGGTTGISATVGTGTGTVDIAAGAQVRGGVDLSNADLAGAAAALATFGDAGGTVTINNAGTVDADNAANSVVIAAGDNVDTVFTNTGTALGMASSTAGAGAVTLTNTNLWMLNTGGATVMAGAGDSFANSGTLSLDSSSLTGIETLTNTGMIVSNGASTLGGTSVVNTGGMITQVDGATGDVLTLQGAVSSTGGTFGFDVDLSAGSTAADQIAVTGGALSGDVTLAFSNVGGTGVLGGPITLIDYDGAFGSTLSFSSAGLPTTGAVLYNVVDNAGASALQLQSSANPAIGGIAGGLTLTRSLIGAVVNRPSSPFVSGLAAEGEACGYGTWARTTGGSADLDGDTTTRAGTFSNSVSIDYVGLQGGVDFACFNAGDGGWDLGFGGFAGFNTGDSTQPVFAFTPGPGGFVPGAQIGRIDTDFDQNYVGLYLTAARRSFVSELQLRYESTDFDISETAGVGGGLGVLDQSFDSTGYTVSGSVSYIVPVNEAMGLTFVPTAGFSYSSADTDDITLAGGANGRIVFDDTETQIGFIGGTLSRAQLLPGGDKAWNYFVTGTVYHDFADDTEARFIDAVSGAVENSSSSNIGTYGELSIGAGFVQILEPGMFGKGRQFNANIRLDGRYGEDIDGWGITAQARVQF